MNQPIEQRFKNIEKRLENLEEENQKSVEAERISLRLSKMHEFNVKEVLAIVGRIELEQGDARERFDAIERKASEHDKRFDHIDKTLDAHSEVLGQILQLLQKKGE